MDLQEYQERAKNTDRNPSEDPTDQKAMMIGSVHGGTFRMAKRRSWRQTTPRTEKRRHQADLVTAA